MCAHMGKAKEDWFRRASEEHPKHLPPPPFPVSLILPLPPPHVCVCSHMFMYARYFSIDLIKTANFY